MKALIRTQLAAALWANDPANTDPDELVEALLPFVEDIAEQRAANEIERIADEFTWETMHDNEVVSTSDLRREVARLRGELEPVTYDFPPGECGHNFPHQYDPETGRCTCGALDHPDWGVTA